MGLGGSEWEDDDPEGGMCTVRRQLALGIALLLWGELAWAQEAETSYANYLFSDRRAHKAGDLLTVIVIESSSASNQASTMLDKEDQARFTANASYAKDGSRSAFVPLFNTDMSNRYEGDASTKRSGEVRATITVRVVDLDEQGNLVIQGSRTVEVNNETQMMVLSGVVRPSDVTAANTVLSSKIVDAQIAYKGNGVVQQGHRPGWLVRLINWLF